MRPIYSKTQDTRLAGAERRIRFLERREQLPNPHTEDELGGGAGGGVDSIAESGATPLTGDVTLSAGTNITLTQTGQNIEIACEGGDGGVGPTADPQYAMFGSDAYTSSAGTDWLSWTSLVTSYGTAPPSINPANSRSILLNTSGIFRIDLIFSATGTAAADLLIELNGGADSGTFTFLSARSVVASYSTGYGCTASYTGSVKASGGAGSGANIMFGVYRLSGSGSLGTPACTVSVEKIAPYS